MQRIITSAKIEYETMDESVRTSMNEPDVLDVHNCGETANKGVLIVLSPRSIECSKNVQIG